MTSVQTTHIDIIVRVCTPCVRLHLLFKN